LITALLYNVKIDSLWLNFGYSEEPSIQDVYSRGVEFHENLPKVMFPHMPKRATFHHLDVAIGYGDQSSLFTRNFHSIYTGINISPEQLHIARQRFPHLDLRVMSATTLRFPDAQFDVVTCVDSAVHFDTRDAFVREAFRVLKPGGRLMMLDMTWPNSTNRTLEDYPVFLSEPGYLDEWKHHTFDHIPIPVSNRVDKGAYEQMMIRAGFKVQRFEDITENIVHLPNERFFRSSPYARTPPPPGRPFVYGLGSVFSTMDRRAFFAAQRGLSETVSPLPLSFSLDFQGYISASSWLKNVRYVFVVVDKP